MSDEYHSPEGTYLRRRWSRNDAQREAASAGWFSRKFAIARLRELEENDGLEEAAQQWARQLLCSEVVGAWGRISPHANQWAPRLLDHLPELAEEAAAAALEKAEDDPLLRGMLTASAAAQFARENVTAVRQIVDDPTIHLLHTTTSDGEPATVLQHAASGLRGRFSINQLDGFGEVFSKPYDIPSINPEAPDDNGWRWELYAGLGIGRRLYLAATDIHPHVRWRARVLSAYTAPLRSRLHAADPHRWAGHCAWCDEQRIIWREADPDDFEQHPITPAPAAIPPRIIEVSL